VKAERSHEHLIPARQLVHPLPDEYDDPVATLVRPATEAEDPLVALVGIPFDTTTLGRRGSRFGPDEVRTALAGLLCYDPGFDVDLARARPIADFGNVDVVQTDVAETWRRVSEVVSGLATRDVPLIAVGGDHGLTFPVLRGLAAAVDKPLGVISVDAHYDVRISHQGEVSAGVPFRYLLEHDPELVNGRNLVQIGAGGWRNSHRYATFLSDHGARVIPARELHRGDLDELVAEALEIAADGTDGIWLTIDIDGVDGSAAPGTGTPAVGGLTSVQLLEIVWAFGRHPKALGIDVMEVAPPYDHGSMTAALAATAILTFVAARHAHAGGGGSTM
jgi:formimidoylglutamase